MKERKEWVLRSWWEKTIFVLGVIQLVWLGIIFVLMLLGLVFMFLS